MYGEQDTALGERGTVPGEEGLLSRSNGHGTGAARPWTGGEDRNQTTSTLWSRSVSKLTDMYVSLTMGRLVSIDQSVPFVENSLVFI